MNHHDDFLEKEAIAAMLKYTPHQNRSRLFRYMQLLTPIMLFPVLYFPYTLWWRRGFAEWAVRVTQGSDARLVRLMLTGNNTILLFWCLVTAVVMLASVVLSVMRVRPWYLIPLYLAVMFSFCGIFSLMFYNAILR